MGSYIFVLKWGEKRDCEEFRNRMVLVVLLLGIVVDADVRLIGESFAINLKVDSRHKVAI